MLLDKKNRKRLLIFLLIPILAVIPFVTEDVVLRVIAAVLLIIYVGFIIFLRDSLNRAPALKEEDSFIEPSDVQRDTPVETDEGEGFEIVSGSTETEIITADNLAAPLSPPTAKSLYHPPELKKEYLKIASETVPANVGQDEYFGFVLEKILQVAKEAFLAHSAMFFWYNKKKETLNLDRFVSASKDISRRKFEKENDILSQIIEKEEPLWLPNISATTEADNIRYYSTPQGIRSFVGVPLFYGKTIAGILALDSKGEDSFNVETVYSLGRLVRVISIIISLFEEKFTESLSEQRLKSLLSIFSVQKKFAVAEDLFDTIENAVKKLIHWDAFAFVYYDAVSNNFKIARTLNKRTIKYVGEGLEVELRKSLTGKAILTGMPVSIEDTSGAEKRFVRFSEAEDISFEGSFLAIPLVYDEQNFGALCFESLKKSVYSNSDILFLRQTSRIFAFIAFAHSGQRFLKSLLSVDIETKILNKETFLNYLRKDLLKAREFSAPGVVVLIYVDKFLEQDTLFESNPFPKVLKSIIDSIKEDLPDTSLLGRLSTRMIAVSFFNSSTKEAFIWAEKLRVKIARKPIPVMSKQSTFTISAGVASTHNKTNLEEIMETAQLALNKAIEKGGNAVVNAN
jgi:diguanylate cyclase (GGDEF)-like protein